MMDDVDLSPSPPDAPSAAAVASATAVASAAAVAPAAAVAKKEAPKMQVAAAQEDSDDERPSP